MLNTVTQCHSLTRRRIFQIQSENVSGPTHDEPAAEFRGSNSERHHEQDWLALEYRDAGTAPGNECKRHQQSHWNQRRQNTRALLTQQPPHCSSYS